MKIQCLQRSVLYLLFVYFQGQVVSVFSIYTYGRLGLVTPGKFE